MSSPQKVSQQPLSLGQNIMAGAFAGMAELCCMWGPLPLHFLHCLFALRHCRCTSHRSCRYPLDVIKTRAQLGHASSGFGSIVSSLRTIQQKEGFRTLYRGISAPMSIEPVKRVCIPISFSVSLFSFFVDISSLFCSPFLSVGREILRQRGVQGPCATGALVQPVCLWRACRNDRMCIYRRS